MLSVRLEQELEAALKKLAAATGRSKSYHVKEALTSYLQDHADYLLTLAALERQEPRTSLADVRQELGLERSIEGLEGLSLAEKRLEDVSGREKQDRAT